MAQRRHLHGAKGFEVMALAGTAQSVCVDCCTVAVDMDVQLGGLGVESTRTRRPPWLKM